MCCSCENDQGMKPIYIEIVGCKACECSSIGYHVQLLDEGTLVRLDDGTHVRPGNMLSVRRNLLSNIEIT